ncbi:MAG: DNA/RNA non-specific endonuclease [Chitinophagaceae bacterium]|nr:DNA/RNA non-specific endonuclease [Oligoflexus sp.]
MLSKYFKLSVILLLVLGCGRSSDYEVSSSGRLPASSGAGVVLGSVDPGTNPNIPYGPLLLSQGQDSITISRPEYELSWNPSTRDINWASWLLSAGDIGHSGRTQFTEDSELETYLAPLGQHAVTPDEYSGSCFDRGHQVPSADRTHDFAENTAVFKMSNMIPQTGYLNRGDWEHLEADTRSVLNNEPKTRIWIVAGPIFGATKQYMGLHHDIAVPTANFKIVIDLGPDSKAKPSLYAAVIMPNTTSKGTSPVTDRATLCADSSHMPASQTVGGWKAYTKSLNEIEKEAGIDLTPVRKLVGASAQ